MDLQMMLKLKNLKLSALLVGATLSLGALSCQDDAPPATPTPALLEPVAPTQLVAVRVRDGRLIDAHGRQLRVRGVNARVEGLFDVTFDDGRERLQPLAELSAQDAQQMADFGFNMLRLPINWSGLEPVEGQLDEAYFTRVDEVLSHAKAAGIYVLIDVHQDAYSKHIGEDGAPLWAIVPPPKTLLEGPLDEDELGRRRVSGQVISAFQSFWDDKERIQQRWMPMWSSVVARWHTRDEVIGFEPFNEPIFSDRAETKLHAFYARAHQRMREITPDKPLWVEPDALRNFRLSSPTPKGPFLDEHTVYTPHFYPQLTKSPDPQLGWEPIIRPSLEAMKVEAKAWGNAALVVGEWGADPLDPNTAEYAALFESIMDELGAGFVLWLWKERSQGYWGLFDFDEQTNAWTPREDAIKTFGTPAALAIPGLLLEHRFDRQTTTLTVRFEATGEETAGPLLFLPKRWSASGYRVFLNDVELELKGAAAEHDRVVLPWVAGYKGEATLRVTPALN